MYARSRHLPEPKEKHREVVRDLPVYSLVPADESVLFDEDDSQSNWYSWAFRTPPPRIPSAKARMRGER